MVSILVAMSDRNQFEPQRIASGSKENQVEPNVQVLCVLKNTLKIDDTP